MGVVWPPGLGETAWRDSADSSTLASVPPWATDTGADLTATAWIDNKEIRTRRRTNDVEIFIDNTSLFHRL
jgi:hypothetical protein